MCLLQKWSSLLTANRNRDEYWSSTVVQSSSNHTATRKFLQCAIFRIGFSFFKKKTKKNPAHYRASAYHFTVSVCSPIYTPLRFSTNTDRTRLLPRSTSTGQWATQCPYPPSKMLTFQKSSTQSPRSSHYEVKALINYRSSLDLYYRRP